MKQRIRTVTLLLACLVLLTGCQTLNFWKDDASKQNASAAGPSGLAGPSPAPTREQGVNFMLEMATLFEQQGETRQAMGAYQGVLAKEQRPLALHRMGVLSAKQGQIRQAIDYYERALQKGGEDPDVLCDLGYSLYLAGRFKDAEAHLRRAVELAPMMQRGHANLGMVFARTGRYNDALMAFSRAGLTESEARNNLALAMMVDQRLADAEGQYKLAMRVDPNCASARRGLAALQRVQERATASQPMGPPSTTMARQPGSSHAPPSSHPTAGSDPRQPRSTPLRR